MSKFLEMSCGKYELEGYVHVEEKSWQGGDVLILDRMTVLEYINEEWVIYDCSEKEREYFEREFKQHACETLGVVYAEG